MARKTTSTKTTAPQEGADLSVTETQAERAQDLAQAAETATPDLPELPQDTPQPPSTEDSLEPAQGEDKAEVQSAQGGITVTITGPKKGRWRAGRHFSGEPTVLDLDDLTEDELAALRADPSLTIEVG